MTEFRRVELPPLKEETRKDPKPSVGAQVSKMTDQPAQEYSSWEPTPGPSGVSKSKGAIPKYNRRLPAFRTFDEEKKLPAIGKPTGPSSSKTPIGGLRYAGVPSRKDKMQQQKKKGPVSFFKEMAQSGKGSSLTRTRSIPQIFVGDGSDASVAQYLDVHKDFLENYVLKVWDINEFENLYYKKLLILEESSSFYPNEFQNVKGFCLHKANVCNLNDDLTLMSCKRRLRKDSSPGWLYNSVVTCMLGEGAPIRHIYNLVCYLTYKIGVDAYRVYVLDRENPADVQYLRMETSTGKPREIMEKCDRKLADLILDVACTEEVVCMSRGLDDRFPKIPQDVFESFNIKNCNQANHVLYLPLLKGMHYCAYVIEMWRITTAFSWTNLEVATSFVIWVSMALHFVDKYKDVAKRMETADSMLQDVKSLFEDMVSLDQVIKRILKFAQKLVKADRASLFLVDERTQELVSTVFDLKLGSVSDNGDSDKKEIRIPIHRGIAGHVARTGNTMNITDAYKDPRFNSQIDQETGYKTNTILCMPIKVNNKVVGVVQMVNKQGTRTFLHEDEVSFERCAPFFGLALHHANLYEQISRKEQQNRITLDVLSYHNTCKQEEVFALLRSEELKLNLVDYYLDPFELDEKAKCKAVIEMFFDLFRETNIDIYTVTRFVLTVKKNYRLVPYHNFNHGWSVAHSMFVMLKTDKKRHFTFREALALFVAAFCHDLDHRGYTNQYMREIASPLAAMYTTSTLEHHHFNITATILQQEGHNIFRRLSHGEYKEILKYIRHCILATDLATFSPNLKQMKRLLHGSKRAFDWENNDHRKIAMAMCMTAADLSASAKPWHIQKMTTNVIFEEFYNQGDKERAYGKVPIPMMDRTKRHEQPASQVSFIKEICIPCYSTLAQILPNTEPLLEMVLSNLSIWESKVRSSVQSTDPKSEIDTFDDVTDVSDDVFEESRVLFDDDGDPSLLQESILRRKSI